jgi:hypothetical protein
MGVTGAAWAAETAKVPVAPPPGEEEMVVEDDPTHGESYLRDALEKLDRWGLFKLLETERDVDAKQKLRARETTHPDELARLALDEDSGVRFYVAANRYTPLLTRADLAADPVAVVRAGVAMSLELDPMASPVDQQAAQTIAVHLAVDPQAIVRLALAANAKLTTATYETLAGDADPLVRTKLAENPQASTAALARLSQDSIATIRAQALSHPDMPPELLRDASRADEAEVRLAVAGNANTPMPALVHLASDASPEVREAVARHPVTPLRVLRQLAADSTLAVACAVARHPHADRRLLMALAEDRRDSTLRQTAQDRLVPLLRGEIREDVLQRWDNR